MVQLHVSALDNSHFQVVHESLESSYTRFNPLNAELKPTYHLLALLGAHHIFHVSGLRVNMICVQWGCGG